MHPRVDYDSLAGTYNRRYQHNDYSGVEHALTEFAGRNIEARVLEVGCGTGHWLRMLGERGFDAVGVDASARMLEHARAHPSCTVLLGVAERLPLSARSFDRLFCVNALHHFEDKPAFLAEARRVLRPGGRMMTIGLDPHAGTEHWYIYEYFESALDTDRRRYASREQIRAWMGSAGFVDCATREVQHIPARLSARAAIEQGRLDRKATSQLALLTDEQYQRGMDRIRNAIESAEAGGDSLFLSADLRLYATSGSVPP